MWLLYFWPFLLQLLILSVTILPTLNNGKLQLEGRTPPFMPGDSIQYTCDPGYISEQNPKVICTNEDGVANWTRTENACRLLMISCNDPGYIENARRIGHVFTFPNNITYVCNEGYKLIGTAVRYCSSKGQWLPNSSPLCEAIICPILPDPLNGKVISSQRRLHAVATYECDRRFNLSGNAERVITCFDPGDLLHGRVIPQQRFHKAGDLVIFKCKYDFHQTTSKCLRQVNGVNGHPLPSTSGRGGDGWLSTATHIAGGLKRPSTTETSRFSTVTPDIGTGDYNIRKASCDDPGKIKNGERIFVGLSINSTVTYTCDEGYELRGKATLLCMENGKWDLDKLPICVKPLSVPSIIGIILGVVILIAIGIAGYFWYRWREKKIRGYGDKSKALTADATDLEEIAGLESGKNQYQLRFCNSLLKSENSLFAQAIPLRALKFNYCT
ncbi:sushi, von Willebrand factor type A, EGF and pentraxin domain-containing protein 1 [Caerostris extrusa]|uniref:Sushi, von Willebrand factor type A, EGF and pentraxin domain-containing protein 1 n=1 Tax=Caerostris extrusa TaxID=172846 RepID=A0AAV4YF59_CAEEX|nr:sushi, von Willebrand factor type A, EGF and pentraxin domain-containing protein 1 [Caerostris extrusa]